MKFLRKYQPQRFAFFIFVSLLVFTVSAVAQEPAPFDIRIKTVHDQLPGHATNVEIMCNYADAEITGFDFLILLESVNLAFVDAGPGEFIERCGWQYFNYRYYEAADIGINTPTDLIRISAAAECNTGSVPPDCHLPNAGESLVQMSIRVRPGCNYCWLSIPIRFVWTECNDNSLVLRSGGSRAISRYVYDKYDQDITDTGQALPSIGGAPNSCLDNTPPEEQRLVDFHNGRISTICDDICIDRGDINCNAIPYEAADPVFLINMFIWYMGEIWPDFDECHIINSDVNADGIELSVADLVYLVRVIAGDAPIYPKPLPVTQTMDVFTRPTATGTEIFYRSPVDIGGLLIRFELKGPSEIPIFGLPLRDMEVQHIAGDDWLGMLVYDEEGDIIPAGEGVLVTIPGEVSPEISKIDASDWSGQVLSVNVEAIPGQFQLSQNRPNPFNMSTEIALSLPGPSQWRLTVYNILGQMIREYSGQDNAGQVSVFWDGCDNARNPVASGIYFYRAVAGSESQTRKMFLLK